MRPPLLNARTVKPQRHLLREDLIEDCLRDQGLLTQTTPANRELLFRSDAFLGPLGRGRRVLEEPASESVSSTPHHFTSNP